MNVIAWVDFVEAEESEVALESVAVVAEASTVNADSFRYLSF